MQDKNIPLFVSANPNLGAFNVTSGNDRFSIQFKRPIIIPDDDRNITLELHSGEIWWTVLNIKLGINDAFRLEVDGDAVYDITIEPGLYNTSALNSAINSALINEGLASGLITLTAQNSTGKVLLSFSVIGLQVTWVAGSMFELLGFTSGQLVPDPTFTTGPYSELAPNIANFSDISSFLVHTNLVRGGIPLGDTTSQAIANIQINVPPGSLINFAPNRVIQIDANHLRGTTTVEASFWITDQLNRTIDFNGEYFSLLIIIRSLSNDHQTATHI